MRPAWSVLLLTTLIGAGQGLYLALVAADVFFDPEPPFLVAGAALAEALLLAGLGASFFHLGRPERAWRSAAMWRTSWLAREVIALPAFMAVVLGWGAAHWLGRSAFWWSVPGVALALALFLCTGMIYACLRFLQEWHTPLTPINYTLLGCASGLSAAAALASWRYPPLARFYVAAALAVGALAYVVRLASLARNMRLRPTSSAATAIGVKHPRIAQIAQGAMGGSFNTREFFHGRRQAVVRAVRWTFLALGFPVPALLMILFQYSFAGLMAAFLVQYAGLLAERWYFFAEARHPQNLYYQSIA